MFSPLDRMNQTPEYQLERESKIDLGKITSFLTMLAASGGLLNRHARVQVPQTVTYGTNGVITVPRGNYNLIQLQVTGTTTATAGADANHGTMDTVSQITFDSENQGQIGQFNGPELYYLGLMFGITPPITNCGTGGGTSSCSWFLPIWIDSNDTLKISVEWAALANWHSSATAYTGVMTCVPDFIPDMPTAELRYRRKQLGAAGVVGAAASLPEVPQPVKGFNLFGFMCIMSDTAKGTLGDHFSTYQLEHNHGIPIGNPINATHIRDAEARDIGAAHTTGIDFCRFAPINNDSGTVLTITNGATATVDYTRIVYMYVSENISDIVYDKGSDGLTKNWGVQPDLEVTTEGNQATPISPRGRSYIPEGKYGDRWDLRPKYLEEIKRTNRFDRFFK